MSHERPPEQLSKEIWFYSLERRRQTTSLRRVTIALTVIAVILMFVATGQPVVAAGALAAVAAVVTLEVAGYLRGESQKKAILCQLRDGVNPQLVDAVGSNYTNRKVMLLALAIATAIGLISLVVIGLLT